MINKSSKAKTTVRILSAAALIALTCAALDVRLRTVTYTLPSPKVNSPVRLAIVADLHSCRYGKNMETLLRAVRNAKPHAILLPGDFFDDDHHMENARIFAAAAVAIAPTFYVTGNHEIVSGQAESMKEELRALGITVLEGDAVPLTALGETIWICGADDPAADAAAKDEIVSQQRQNARAAAPEEDFAVLLSHRPELTEEYRSLGFDLVVSGHAHGGQWRIPFLLNGLLAPHQGMFPDYAGGLYDLGTTTLIVSRGLARETTLVPRIFNRPELVLVEIQ